MKKSLLSFIAIILISTYCYSQIKYEKGYFIDNSGNKTECLIKNVDWKNTPSGFSYKINETSEEKENTIESVREFGVYNFSKYVRETVNIDLSSDNPNKLDNKRTPIFNKETLFLKVLIEGEANLYSYNNGNLLRFFYSTNKQPVQQLIYKKYYKADNRIGKNNRFQQQIWTDLKCESHSLKNVESLSYNSNSLTKHFIAYNDCKKSSNKIYYTEYKVGQNRFDLTFKVGLNTSSYYVKYGSWEADFSNKLGINFGIEAEYFLPFNKNKWSIKIEPAYLTFNSEKTVPNNTVSGGYLTTHVNYKLIQIPVGLKHYFFLNNNFKIYTSAAYVFNINTKPLSTKFSRIDNSELIVLESTTPANNIALDLGLKYKKYSVELRYQPSINLVNGNTFWSSEFNTLSINFGYSLF